MSSKPPDDELIPSITNELQAISQKEVAELRAKQAAAQTRSAERLPSNLMVLIRDGDRDVVLKARDLSASGVFLESRVDLPARTRVRIPLPAPYGEIYAFCSVVRREAEGLAVNFDEIEWEDRQRLIAYLSTLSQD